ncbi:MarR family transcriptional regulator [Nocardia sp. NPDC047038]|uniref:MarR family transcriptional regulator n=1 Tax=Nocardia sp. NPDC047038 TaxID=3154338 RepID=UPI0033EFCBA6
MGGSYSSGEVSRFWPGLGRQARVRNLHPRSAPEARTTRLPSPGASRSSSTRLLASLRLLPNRTRWWWPLCEPSNATVIIDKLEALRLIERQTHPTDRRAKQSTLTSECAELRKRGAVALAASDPAAARAAVRAILDWMAGA